MKAAVLGAGPAGLYFSYLLKSRLPDVEIQVYEQNPADATFGFGVVFSDRALDFLREDDPQTYNLITPAMESWSDMVLDVCSKRVRIDGVGFSAVGRLELLHLLRQRASGAGVPIEYERTIGSLEELAGADLVVGADGVNSLVRNSTPAFAGDVTFLSNRFIWYGTSKRFETLTQTFRTAEHGAFNAHHYRYSPSMSTFIIETDERTWQRTQFEKMSPEATRAYCERVFADTLDGHRLISNKSIWRNFPKVRNEHWWTGNRVLLGDALHTAHFSIGSGTRLAMEDAIALVNAICAEPRSLTGALAQYEASRRPILDKLVTAANASAEWYGHFADHLKLDPLDFAMSYVMRSGRIDIERLRRMSPKFVAEYEAAHRGHRAPSVAQA
jgi:2-polyprenyl-6-methoxyphenol hydroxylase-like FAD-dependent oxidoreductase